MSRIALSRLLGENVRQLPRVPLQSIETTAKRYLESLVAVRGGDAMAVQQAKMEAFLQSSGQQLQLALAERDRDDADYVSRCVRELELRQRAPLEVYRNPGFVLKRGCVDSGSQASVAASLIHGVACWIRDAVREGVASGEGGRALDLRPLAHEFGRSLVPSKEKDEVKTVPLEQLQHVIVLHDGHANVVRVLEDGAQRVVGRQVIERALEVILSTTPDEDNPSPVSVLTAGSRSLWGQAYEELLKTPENAEKLRLFQEGILVVCLDSKAWPSDGSGDVCGSAALHGRQEEAENRWYDKHQLIVSADGQAAFNFESSSSWMPHWAHWIDEVLATAASSASEAETVADAASEVSKVLRPLVVTYGKSFATHIRTARQEVSGLVETTEGRGVTLPLGSSELSRVGLSGESFVQLVLHLAHYRRRGCLCPASRVTDLSGYFGGLTDLARTASPEMLKVCEMFRDHVKPGEFSLSTTKREELVKVVKAAAERHEELVRAAACGEGVDRHLRALEKVAEERSDEAGKAFFADAAYQLSSRFLMNTCEFRRPWLRLVVVGPNDNRGCGVGFTVDNSETRMHVATGADSPLCGCEEHTQTIVTAAMDLYRALGGTSV